MKTARAHEAPFRSAGWEWTMTKEYPERIHDGLRTLETHAPDGTTIPYPKWLFVFAGNARLDPIEFAQQAVDFQERSGELTAEELNRLAQGMEILKSRMNIEEHGSQTIQHFTELQGRVTAQLVSVS